MADTERVPTRQQQRDLGAVRPGLERWLRGHVAGGEYLTIRDLRLPVGSGVANETLLVTAETAGREAGYVVRVGASDHLYMDMDVARQFRMYELLAGKPDIPSPAVIGLEADRALFGEPFFVMEWIDGLVPSDNPSFLASGWVTELSPTERRAMWERSIEVLARLHRIDPAELPFLDRPWLGATGIEQELAYWLRYARWCGGDRHAIVRRAGAWLVENLPRDAPPGLSWGDARPQNIIYRGTRPVAVLDWDTVSLAGAECDLAWWAYMAQSAVLEGWGTRRELLSLWQELAGRRPEYLDWHLVLTAYRLRVIMVRLAAMLRASGLIDAAAQADLDSGEMEWLGGLLDRPLCPAHDSRWPGWDQ